jgi:hypothetical protein
MPAKTGNTNALKHGLYAKRFRAEELKDLRQMPADDLRAEIALLRVTLSRITSLIEDTEDADIKTRYINAATNAALAIATLARTHAILTGKYNPLEEALIAALSQTSPYHDNRENQSPL